MEAIALRIVDPCKSVVLVPTVDIGINLHTDGPQPFKRATQMGDAESRRQPVLPRSSSLVRVIGSQGENGSVRSKHAEATFLIRRDDWRTKDLVYHSRALTRSRTWIVTISSVLRPITMAPTIGRLPRSNVP